MNGTAKVSRAMDRKHAGRSWGSLCMQWAIFCCLTLALLLLAGCSGRNENEKSGGVRPGGNGILGGGAEEDVGGAEDFYGCWEYADWDYWLTVYDDGTYTLLDGAGDGVTGGYYMEDGALCLDDGSFCFTLDGAGGLVDSDGDALFRSSPPDTAEDSNGWEDPDDWEDPSGWEDPDIQQLGAGAEEFYGCWEYQYADEWLYVRDDGTYMWYDADGYSHEGSYTVSGETLLLDGNGLSYVVRDGGIVDDYGNLMFRSVLPDVDGTALLGAEGFFGCWEGTSGGVWLTIFDDGTYEWMWDDGYGAAGSYYMEDGVLCLQSGTRFTLDEESGFIESEDDVMFPSQLPANLQ